MSTLSKIRNNIGLVIALIVISLAAFILTDFFTGKTRGLGRDQNAAGEVAGQEIPATEINNRADNYSRGRQDQDKAAVDQLQRDVWNEIVQEIINNKEYKSLGMSITDREESMLYFGPIVNPYVYQFPWFRNDTTGVFSPDMIRARFQMADQIDINNPRSDAELNFKLDMLNLKKFLITNRLAQKWENLIKGGVFVSDNEIRRSNIDQQKKVNISYLSVPYASISDDQVNVTDNDYQEYYDAVKESFKRGTEQVSVKYTLFPVKPSLADSNEAISEISEYREEFLEAEDAHVFAYQSSNAPVYDTTLKKISQLPAALQGITNPDTIVGPVLGAEGYELLRVVKTAEDTSSAVKARHILVQYKGPTAQDTIDARQTANQIRNQVEADPSTFAAVVLEKSDDFASKATGGELGWMDPLSIGGDFAKDVNAAPIGRFIVTQSRGGYHVVQVMDRSNLMVSYAALSRTIGISSATDDSVSKRASQYASRVLSGESMDDILPEFPEAVTQVSPPLVPSSYALRDLEDARPVISWAFQQDEAGVTSEDLIKTDDAFVIARVLTKGGNDYAPLLEVREQLTPAVKQMVKARTIKQNLSALSGDLASMASTYGPGATTGSVPGLTFASNAIPGLGTEPKVVGRAFGMNQGETSKPIAGNTAVYVIKVESVTDAPDLAENDINIRRQALVQQKENTVFNNAANGLRDIANIKDYRYLFPNL